MFATLLKWGLTVFLSLVTVLFALVIAYRFLPPPSTLMIKRWILHEKVERTFVPLSRVSPRLLEAVIISEDTHFCRHHGVDWGALREVVDQAVGGNGVERGASTVTMQTVKNLFLWPSHSYFRKALEIPLALGLNLAWPKRRIFEVYLNIAEWGDGIFGVEAAAETYFHKHASDLDEDEAILLASILPNPRHRNPLHPSRRVTVHASVLTARLGRHPPRLDCLR